MSEININIVCLKDAITQLSNLRKNYVDYKILCPDTIGGGLTVTELNNLVKIYNNLDNCFIQLLNSTIGFMENVQESYENSDKKAANKILGK